MEAEIGAWAGIGIFVACVVWFAYEIGVIYLAIKIMGSTPASGEPLLARWFAAAMALRPVDSAFGQHLVAKATCRGDEAP